MGKPENALFAGFTGVFASTDSVGMGRPTQNRKASNQDFISASAAPLL